MNLFDLQVGDTFIEDGYGEVWRVTAAPVTEYNMIGVDSVCVGYISEKSDTGRVGETSFWGCSEAAYCPDVYPINDFYIPVED